MLSEPSLVTTADLPGQKIVVQCQTGQAEIIDALAPAWSRLCDELQDAEPFFRPEWTRACHLAFFPDSEVILLSAWSAERLVAVLPLMKERTWFSGLPVTRLSLVATVHSFRVGMVRREGAEGDEAVRALWDAIEQMPGWDVIDIAYALEGGGLETLANTAQEAGFHVARSRTSQALYLPIASPEGKPKKDALPPWLACTRPKFRANLRRARRQLEEQGALTLRHVTEADPEALEKFYALEASGWKGQQGTAILSNENTRVFYNEIAKAAADDGYLSLDFLELNGRPIAAHYALNVGGRYFLAKAGYDERFHRYSPGQLLVNEILNETEARGLRELDFVGPATWDEGRWAVLRRDHLHLFIFRKSFYGAMLHSIRITARGILKGLLKRSNGDDADLALLSQPQGGE
ncbi:MAG TPA: GNAT family N-acetyltransferase [Candidatus Angelobacter sp.]|nr:GNAT family N-acetyltransferase [Candidatus Angelobacter sp.]